MRCVQKYKTKIDLYYIPVVARKNAVLLCAEYQGRGAKIAPDTSRNQDYVNEEYDTNDDGYTGPNANKNGFGKVCSFRVNVKK